MRLSEARIKEAILDSDLEIRQRAISYFAKSYSTDLSIMPLVIKAVENFGRQDAYHLIGLSRDLPHTSDTIDWIIEELNGEQSDQFENYTYNLSMVLVKADPALLLLKESAILESKHFLPTLHVPFRKRLEMLSWDEATCWQKLEEFCEEGKDKQYINEVNLGYANQIVEALARYGDDCEEEVLAVLRQKVDDFHHNPMKWMEPLVVRLAGESHLDSTVPSLVTKLIEDGGDLLNGECAQALTRIGTPAVVDHFAPEGIEETRKLLVGRDLDFESQGLRSYLIETCTIMGERFPEYDDWRTAEKSEKDEHRKRVQQLEGDPIGLMRFALEKLTGKNAAGTAKASSSVPLASRQSVIPKSESRQRVGRNDPCPCGSGKKFKQCCLRRNVNE